MTVRNNRRAPLRYSVVFCPQESTESLRMTYQQEEIVEEEAEDDECSSPSFFFRLRATIGFVLVRLVNYGFLVPLVFCWKTLLATLHLAGCSISGTALVMTILQLCFFRPIAFCMYIGEALLNLVGFSLDGPAFRSLIGLSFNGFGFCWHAAHDTFTTPVSHWRSALERFHTFLEQNGLDLEMKLAINDRFLNNISVYDDVQRMLGLELENRVQETKLVHPQVNIPPDFDEALHFMHFATAAYGMAVMVGCMIETKDSEGLKRVDRIAGRNDGLNDERQVLAYLNCRKEDVVVSNLTSGGSMDVLRHLVVVDHSKKALVFAIRGTFSISGIISDWVSFCAPFCGGVGHVAMSEVARRMWDLTKDRVLAMLETLPSDYEVVITGHSLGAGVANLLTILVYHEKYITSHKVRCFAFAPPPTFYPLEAAPQAVAATTAYIHGDDTAPFLSVYHLRRFFKSMASLDRATRGMSTWDFLRIDWGYEDPSEAMVEAVRKAEELELRKVKGAERVAIPAKAVVWLQQPTEEQVASGVVPKHAFIPHICDPEKLAQLPIRVPSTQRQLLTDHLASKYEIALKYVRCVDPITTDVVGSPDTKNLR